MKSALGVFAVLVILGSGASLYFWKQGVPRRGVPVATPTPLICEQNDFAYVQTISLADLPVRCCNGEGLAYRAMYCRACKILVPLKGSLEQAQCPQCSGRQLTLDVPVELMQECP